MAFLGHRTQDDLIYQINSKDLKIGTPAQGTFENLTVNSGAILPAFDSLVVKPLGTSQLGTVTTTSVWNGSGITEAYGGTGQSAYAVGDILVADGAASLAKLPIGVAGTTLGSDGSTPVWGHPKLIVTSAGQYDAAADERFVMASGGIVVALPSAALVGQTHLVKDVVGVAATGNVTVSGLGGELIDGATTFVLTNNYQAANFVWNGSSWSTF